jgi:hypothetical protein
MHIANGQVHSASKADEIKFSNATFCRLSCGVIDDQATARMRIHDFQAEIVLGASNTQGCGEHHAKEQDA